MGARRTNRQAQSGMTLPEVLIALLIFAIIASASVFSLRLGIDSRDQLSKADAALKEMQIARLLLKEDLAQLVARPVRDEFGSQRPGIIFGGQVTFSGRSEDDEKILFSFVRGGWLNPDAVAPRSALQSVEYIFKNGNVIRRAYIYPDEVERSDVSEKILYTGLSDATSEFQNGVASDEMQWVETWPLPGTSGGAPKAIALTIHEENGEPLRQLFWLGQVGAP